MAKPKKEFKSRVRKVQKHITALTELAVSDYQRGILYEIEERAKDLEETTDAQFDQPEELERKDTPSLVPASRRDPHGIAN